MPKTLNMDEVRAFMAAPTTDGYQVEALDLDEIEIPSRPESQKFPYCPSVSTARREALASCYDFARLHGVEMMGLPDWED